jgi:Cd2+/Zn2+-exporting ATPase
MNALKRQWNDRAARRRLVVVFAGTLIVLALAFGRVEATAGLRDPLMVVAALLAGADIARRAWDGLRRRQITIELLVTIAATGALIIGEVWEAAAVTFLFALGAWLEARTMARTRKALSLLIDLVPATALVLRDRQLVEVDPLDVEMGEAVTVKPGARVPVDGVVTAGRSAVDESAITGEPIPAEKRQGDRVFAGTVSHDGVLTVEATGVGVDTTLARIVHRVEEAQDAKAPAQRTIERFATWYTPSIIVLAIGAWIITRDVELALTLLVIGCPGELVIATPVAIVAGIGRAAKRGILIKGGEFLEAVGRVTTVAMDKTGTLTWGKPELTDVVVLQPALVTAAGVNEAGWTADDVVRWAAIAERGSGHPLARPIVAAAEQANAAPLPQPDDGEAVAGKGVVASWNGHRIGVGTSALMEWENIPVPGDALDVVKRLESEGKTAMLVALDGEAIGVLGVTDVPRENASQLPELLREAGVRRVAMLTGDNAGAARIVGNAVGIEEVRAGMLPEDKLAWIREAQASGEVVAMVGDGINDAPALATADVGIAMGAAGSDIALETADVALMADHLERIPEALRISRATLRVIRQNLLIAVLTVGFLLAGVAMREVDMAGGMLIHEVSVLIVILNGMRLMRA